MRTRRVPVPCSRARNWASYSRELTRRLAELGLVPAVLGQGEPRGVGEDGAVRGDACAPAVAARLGSARVAGGVIDGGELVERERAARGDEGLRRAALDAAAD